MQIEILDALIDAQNWRHTIKGLPDHLQDVYFYPEYAAMHCFEPESRCVMFKYSRSDKVWLYTFLFKPIVKIGDYSLQEQWSDIETPYGYGGPLSNTENHEFLTEAHEAFSKWCREQKIVAEFIRFHPILQNGRWVDAKVKIIYERENVSLNLNDFDEEKPPFDSKTRNMLRRAKNSGIQIRTYFADECFDRFVELYLERMKAISAEKFYYFNDNYFSLLWQLVKKTGWLLVAEKDDEWLSAAVFLNGCQWIHYHLSAANQKKHLPGSTNLILYTSALKGKEQGLKVLHLGGGISGLEVDSLLKFKRSMATDSHKFCIGKRIHDIDKYSELKEVWRSHFPSLVPVYGKRLLCYRYEE